MFYSEIIFLFYEPPVGISRKKVAMLPLNKPLIPYFLKILKKQSTEPW